MKHVDIKRILVVVFGVILVLIGGLFVYQAVIVSSRASNQQNQQEIMEGENTLDQSEVSSDTDHGFPSDMESGDSKESTLDTNQMLRSLEQDNEDPATDLQSIEQELQSL